MKKKNYSIYGVNSVIEWARVFLFHILFHFNLEEKIE